MFLAGPWLTSELPQLVAQVDALLAEGIPGTVDATGIEQLDTGGAWLLNRLIAGAKAKHGGFELNGLAEPFRQLLELVQKQDVRNTPLPQAETRGTLEQIGRRFTPYLLEVRDFLQFVGETTVALVRIIGDPRRIRWAALVVAIENAGVRAVPIVALLSFLLGIVIAYQGSVQLRSYGANIFIVELVTLTIVRELAPMMTAIIIAGRTGSAYTAEIGTMRVAQEIDALQTLGISPIEMLVLPKVSGLLMTLPLLTLIADIMGVIGGMAVASNMLGVGYQDFFYRIPHVVPLNSFLVGIVKAPAFALIVGLMGSYQGLTVTGGADAVGRQTTVSVVQSIFLVIVTDAAFSILFGWLGV